MEDLNRKMAEWAGFKQLALGRSSFHWEHCQRVPNWMPPNTTDVWMSTPYLPDFTHSLDACFMWLVPKVRGITTHSGYREIILSLVAPLGFFKEYDAPLALCKAIEELIEKERD